MPVAESALAAELSGGAPPESLLSLLRSRRCIARTVLGRRCRSAPVAGGVFCSAHWRAGAGVPMWGGPADDRQLRPERNGPLARVLVAVKAKGGGVHYHAGGVPSAKGVQILGVYHLVGDRYKWRTP